jgi:hypothetical protein
LFQPDSGITGNVVSDEAETYTWRTRSAIWDSPGCSRSR